MAEMDLDELFGSPTKGPNRPLRFVPKGAKFKPKPKTEPSQSLPPSPSDHVESLSVPKKEDIDVKPDMKPEYTNNAIDMDVEVKPGVKEEEREDLMETDEMEVEFENEVLREIDVYFSPSIDPLTQLYLFQFPLRPLWRPYELDDRCEEVRVKPESSEVEIDLAIDVESKSYDSGVDPSVQMKKQTLTSSWKPPQTSGSTVGILTGNKLHLSPFHAVVQLKPSMHHLDSKEPKTKTVARSNAEVIVKSKEDQEAQPAGTSTNMVWGSLKYHGVRSDMAAGYLQTMMAKEGSQSQIYFSMSSYDYLKSLCPGISSDSFSSKGPPKRLLALPLIERFKTRLCEDPQVHRFDALKCLAPDKSPEEVLEVLHEHARLVQGLWVAKSSLVYGTDQGFEVLARDYVLLMFRKNVTINKSKIPQRRQLEKAMENGLNVLARERPMLNDWKLKELPDLSFMKLYPSFVKKQEEEWECLEPKISGLIFGERNGPGMKTSSKSSTTNNPTTSKGSNKTATSTPSGSTPRTGMSEEVQEAKGSNKIATRTTSGSTPRTGISEEERGTVTKALQKLFKSIKVCRFEQISQRLRDMAVSGSARSTGFTEEAVAAANTTDAFPDELQAIISQVAINVHGICVPISSPDHQFHDFRRIVIDLFIASGPNAKLKKATMLEAAKMKLNRVVPESECKKVLHELCVSRGSAWILRTPD